MHTGIVEISNNNKNVTKKKMFSFHLESNKEYAYIGETDNCPICTDTLQDETQPLSICCINNHVLHTSCLKQLITNDFTKCPECRQPLIRQKLYTIYNESEDKLLVITKRKLQQFKHSGDKNIPDDILHLIERQEKYKQGLVKLFKSIYKIHYDSTYNIDLSFRKSLQQISNEYPLFNITFNNEDVKTNPSILNQPNDQLFSGKIVISYKNICVLYLTNSNWNNYEEEEHQYTHILFTGPVTNIGIGWLSNSQNLVNVDFNGLTSLQTISHRWLYRCKKLVNLDFNGLTSLQTVGDDFLAECQLKNIDFNGLTSLQIVGDNWLSYCDWLLNIDFKGLTSLKTVGNDWLRQCGRIVNLDFNGLTSLQTVDSNWILNCAELENIDFNGLTSLQTVGNFWLHLSLKLINVDFNGLTSLQTVGHDFLSKCRNLINVDFNGLTSLQTVGHDFLSKCRNLRNVHVNNPILKDILEKTGYSINFNFSFNKKSTKKKSTKKKSSRKKSTKKKSSRKTSSRKTSSRKKSSRKTSSRKKSSRKKSSRKKSPIRLSLRARE